jgi:hypothetical protein
MMESVFAEMVSQALLVLLRLVLIHVLITENALKDNVNAKRDLRVLIVLYRFALMIVLIMEFAVEVHFINAHVMKD